MANLEYVRMLRSDVNAWNQWRVNHKEKDLRGADLRGADLRGADLSQVKLAGVDLSGANLKEAILSGADLFESDLSGADLSDADLYEAYLSEADLSKANLKGAELDGANLHRANLSAANLNGAYLRRTNLSRANLSGVSLRQTLLAQTIFFDTNLNDVSGLESCRHYGASVVDHLTLERSGMLPAIFLRGCGLPDRLIEYYPSLLNQPVSFYSCFISYSHSDKAFARRLHDQLQGRGIRCWLDEHQLLPGDDIYDKVDEGIRVWDKVLLCASESSLTSWWVDNEIDSAFRKEQSIMKARKKKVWSLIPLDLDGYMFSGQWERGLAGQVKSRLAADFKGWKTDNAIFEQAFEEIVKALQTDNTGRESKPVPKL